MAWRVQKRRFDFVLFFSVIVSAAIVGAQTTAPAPASQDCQSLAVSNLISCLDYVQPNSTAKAPAKDCCTGINEIFKNDPLCLCQLLLNSSSLGLEFNKTRAFALPTVCKLNTPPVSICYTLLPPASAPFGAESPESGGVAGGPTTGGVVPGSGTTDGSYTDSGGGGGAGEERRRDNVEALRLGHSNWIVWCHDRHLPLKQLLFGFPQHGHWIVTHSHWGFGLIFLFFSWLISYSDLYIEIMFV